MADQQQDEMIVGLGLFGEIAELGFDIGLVACGAGEGNDLRAGFAFENFVEVGSPAGEALFVFRFAAEAGDGDDNRSRRVATRP